MKRPQTISGLLVEVARIYLPRVSLRRVLAVFFLCALALVAWASVPRTCHRHGVRAPHAYRIDLAAMVPTALFGLPAEPLLPLVEVRAGRPVPLWPNLAWNGTGYGLAWIDLRDGDPEVYFVRLSPSGARLGEPLRLTHAKGFKLWPRVVWNGGGYGVTWTAARDDAFDVHFARVDAEGKLVGRSVQLSPADGVDAGASLAWNGNEYGVAWCHIGSRRQVALRFVRVAPTGEILGTVRALREAVLPTGLSDLRWDRDAYVLAWNDFDPVAATSAVRLLRVARDGTPGSVLELARTPGLNGAIAAAPRGGGAAVVWQEDIRGDDDARVSGITFASASPSGVDVRRTALTGRAAYAMDPQAAWNGREYGVAWADNRAGRFDVYFARVAPSGTVQGQHLRVTESRTALWPGLVWNGTEYGLAWTEVREPGVGLFFARISAAGAKLGPDVRITSE